MKKLALNSSVIKFFAISETNYTIVKIPISIQHYFVDQSCLRLKSLANCLTMSWFLFPIVPSIATEQNGNSKLECNLGRYRLENSLEECLRTLDESQGDIKFDLDLGQPDKSSSEAIAKLLPHLNKIASVNLSAFGISYDSLSPVKDILHIEVLLATDYETQELNNFLTNLDPKQIGIVRVVSEINQESAQLVITYINRNHDHTKLDFCFPVKPEFYENPLYLELARLADDLYYIDVSYIPSTFSAAFVPLLQKTRTIVLSDSPIKNIETINELMTHANPGYLAIPSHELFSKIDIQPFIGAYTKLSGVGFGCDLTENLDVLPKLVELLNNVSNDVKHIEVWHHFVVEDRSIDLFQVRDEKLAQIMSALAMIDLEGWSVTAEDYDLVFSRE
jgi:hypothetical protein